MSGCYLVILVLFIVFTTKDRNSWALHSRQQCSTDEASKLTQFRFAIRRQMHQTVGNVRRTLVYTNPPHNLQQAKNLVDTALATASNALHSTVHSTMGLLLGSIVFHRDMFLDIPFVADLMMLREKRQAMIDYNLR
jgi:hypothetical protein